VSEELFTSRYSAGGKIKFCLSVTPISSYIIEGRGVKIGKKINLIDAVSLWESDFLIFAWGAEIIELKCK